MRRGFTVYELLVTVAISGVLIGLAVQLTVRYRDYVDGRGKQALLRIEAALVHESIATDLASARRLMGSDEPGTGLIFELVPAVVGGPPPLVVYSLEEHGLVRKVVHPTGPASRLIVGPHVAGVEFHRTTPRSVRVSLKLSRRQAIEWVFHESASEHTVGVTP